MPSECYLLNEGLGENETAPPPEGCSILHDPLFSLMNSTFPREDFGSLFNLLRPGIWNFMNTTDLASIDIDLEVARIRLEEYIYDNKPLEISDFDKLTAFFNVNNTTDDSTSTNLFTRNLNEVGESLDVAVYFKETDQGKNNKEDDSMAIAMLPDSSSVRSLADDDLSEECIDGIARVVIGVINLILSFVGIRKLVAQPFVTYLLAVKTNSFRLIVLHAFKTGKFDIKFVAGLVVSFLSSLTWQDIEGALSRLDAKNAVSLVSGLFIAIGSTLATGGIALAGLVVSAFSAAVDLKDDYDYLSDNCIKLCDDYSESGGQTIQSFYVALDSSRGYVTLTYNMYSVPDQLELVYEGATIFSTGGLVSGRRIITRLIDGDDEFMYVKITATNSGTAWDFTLTCPQEDIDFDPNNPKWPTYAPATVSSLF